MVSQTVMKGSWNQTSSIEDSKIGDYPDSDPSEWAARLQLKDAMELHHDQYAESVIMKQCECTIIYNMVCKKCCRKAILCLADENQLANNVGLT